MLNCWVTETKETPLVSNNSTIQVASERVKLSLDHDNIQLANADYLQETRQAVVMLSRITPIIEASASAAIPHAAGFCQAAGPRWSLKETLLGGLAV